MFERVLAVIVSYNPELEKLVDSLKGLLLAPCHVLVVDNGSTNQVQIKASIDKLSKASSALTLVALPANIGLGAAHNVGIEKVHADNFDYLLLLDQDTQLLEQSLEHLLTAHRRKTEQGERVSAVGGSYAHGSQDESVYIRFGALKFSRHDADEQDQDACVATDFLISSGSLISVSSLKDIGAMDEGLFIDHVDTEWFLRARSKGYKAYGVPAAKMHHGLGEQTHTMSLAGRQRNVPQHKPFRYYYIFRNSILLYKRSYISALWKWNDIQRLFLIFSMFAIFKAPRKQNMMMMLRGVYHGVLGRTGPLNIADRNSKQES